ncbi:LacI family DNA-binding transcriptional regulator [Paracoccus sp. 1_MG-2023]|uniref:LacI family DNA-binding transcriptional regulator n=1 Tax=unclassified Paracoccus (in: a-proteobacteria) TaxID=2688777 RepID=UPI001C095639|nr:MULTISPECIES: LacI family DNA-binding transcriptional regulator [unclassified Paracoccus (in: a-proteobacteria)]MBU2957690.1 LacI family transcriptional regulator [Paracoccus sp. C2R09]MDO6667462.1 LacI family DNA-binding transcriptional regulator [Paracoccus sp. 1_MG-2023]
MRKRVNLRDVAADAGVSVATVSRVMNSPASVAPATRERVEGAMRRLQWVPSAAARAINSGRTRFVGALVPTLDSDIFARVLANLEQGLTAQRLSLVVATTDDDPKIEVAKARALVDIGAEGLIVSGMTRSPDFHDLIDRARLPTIAISCHDPEYSMPTIGYDNHGAALAALGHLTELGHRRIAVLHGPVRNDRTRLRVAALQGQGDLSFHETALSTKGGCEGVRAVLAGYRPSAILCLSDVIAAGAMAEVQRQGLRVPADMSVMGLDDLPGSAHLYPALSTIHLPVSRMGRGVADALAGWVERDEKPHPHLLDFELIARASTGPCP